MVKITICTVNPCCCFLETFMNYSHLMLLKIFYTYSSIIIFSNNYPYVTSVENVRASTRCRSSKGRLRLLIRSCLDAKCLHIPVEILVSLLSFFEGIVIVKDIYCIANV